MIFYADDDFEDLEIFREIADDLRVELVTFDNGLALLERLKNPPPTPSLIFLDINIVFKTFSTILFYRGQ